MQYQTEILRFEDGARSRHPSPDATVAAAQANALTDVGSQIAVLVDLTPQLPYRSREIRTLVVKTYWASSGSIVARLRRALVTANRHLIAFNQMAPSGNKCAGNLTCAVFSGDELFLGQIGAPYAYIAHPPGVETSRTSKELIELFPRRDRLLIPLGATVPPVINISYTLMSPGSIACLATTQIAEAQAREAWEQALSLHHQRTTSKLELVSSHLSREFGNQRASGSIVLISAQASPVARPAPWTQSRAMSQQRTTPPATIQPASLTPISKPTEAPTAPSPSDEARVTVTPAPATTTPIAEHRTEAAAADTVEEGPRLSLPEINISPPPVGAWIEGMRLRWQERRRIRQLKITERSTTAERARLRQALRTLLPGKVEDSQKTKLRTPPEEKRSVMGAVVLGLVLVVALITLTKYLQLGGPLRAEELLNEAQELRTTAYSTQDPADWRKLLDISGQIVRLDPQNAEAARLRDEAQQAVDSLEHAALLSVSPLLDLGTAPVPRRILAAGGWVYILETATDAVIALPLDEDRISTSAEGPTTILRRGQTYLGEVAEHLVDLAWIGPGGSYPDGALIIYSEGGALFIYEPSLGPGSITVQRIQGELGAGHVTAMASHGESLYLIQRQLGQILMYEPVNGIYDTPRAYFAEGTAPDMQLALDLAVDGRVYLLMGDGSLQTYFSGTHDHSFVMNGLPDADFVPIVMSIDPRADNGHIYLADTQQERIIALNERGDFMHQYRLPRGELQRIESLAVTTNPDVLYVVAENQLLAAPLPDFGAGRTQ